MLSRNHVPPILSSCPSCPSAVHLGVIARFHKMKKYCKGEWAVLSEALKSSTKLVRPNNLPATVSRLRRQRSL